jgi:hypothetical protein
MCAFFAALRAAKNQGVKRSPRFTTPIPPVIVHAGTYSGVTPISLGTNNWASEKIKLLRNFIRFYRVRIN